MTEVLFVLTVIYVAYVFYVIAYDKKAPIKSTPPAAEAEKQAAVAESAPKKELPEAPKTETLIADKKKPPVAASSKKGLKNPKTGEIATTYSNYTFTKRWIKEALVAEGLLEKIYKNNELNADVDASIKAAIAKLEAMEHYKV